MKNFNLFKNNTSWLTSLKMTSVFLGLVSFFSLIIFAVDVAYSVQILKADGNRTMIADAIFNFDVITYPLSFVLVFFETVAIIYCLFNLYSWWVSYSKSSGNRKKFNYQFCLIQSSLFALILIDCVLRLVFVFANIGNYLTLNDDPNSKAISSIYFGSNPLGAFVETDFSNANFGFNTLIIILLSVPAIVVCYLTELKQVRLFKSELKENTRKDVQAHYRELEMKKRRKQIVKMKNKSKKSKKIKVF